MISQEILDQVEKLKNKKIQNIRLNKNASISKHIACMMLGIFQNF